MARLRPQTFDLAPGQAKAIRVSMDAAPGGGVAGWAVAFRLYDPDGAGIAAKTVGDGVVVADAAAGVWDVTLLTTDTTGLAFAPHLWDFWREDGDAATYPLAYGTADVQPAVVGR